MKATVKNKQSAPLSADNTQLGQLLAAAISMLQNCRNKAAPEICVTRELQKAPNVVVVDGKTPLRNESPLRIKPKAPHKVKPSKPAALLNRRSGDACHVYIAGCPGLRERTLETAYSRFKISLNESGNVQARIDELNRDAYGAVVRDGEAFVVEPGFDEWALQQIVAKPTRHDSPVRVLTRSMKVALPFGVPVKVFDDCLRAQLVPRALYAGSETGDEFDPARKPRYTAYSMGSEIRLSRVSEIYHYRLRHDGDWLVSLIESIVESFDSAEFPKPGNARGLRTRRLLVRAA